jgi:hypothetical protein
MSEKPKKKAYRAVTGLDYSGKRVEPGKLAVGLPAKSIPWLLEQGHIEEVTGDE